jgi:hypothetical protein
LFHFDLRVAKEITIGENAQLKNGNQQFKPQIAE